MRLYLYRQSIRLRTRLRQIRTGGRVGRLGLSGPFLAGWPLRCGNAESCLSRPSRAGRAVPRPRPLGAVPACRNARPRRPARSRSRPPREGGPEMEMRQAAVAFCALPLAAPRSRYPPRRAAADPGWHGQRHGQRHGGHGRPRRRRRDAGALLMIAIFADRARAAWLLAVHPLGGGPAQALQAGRARGPGRRAAALECL